MSDGRATMTPARASVLVAMARYLVLGYSLRGCLGIRTEPGASDVFSGAYERREHARSM